AAPGASLDAVTKRLEELVRRVQAAKADKHPLAGEMALKASEAGVFVRKQDAASATRLLDELERLLDGTQGAPVGKTPPAAAPTPAPAPTPADAEDAEEDEDEDEPAPEPTGIDLDAFRKGWPGVRAAWRDAMDEAVAQMGKLRTALLKDPDPDLQQIAEFGLSAVTDGHRVPMMAAVMSIDGAMQNEAKLRAAIGQARAQAKRFSAHLQSSPTVAACDENPFGVEVSLRDTLGGALAGIEDFFRATAASRPTAA
ncbi:MAG: hypothetical protein WAP57_09180, partial [Aquabacterium commune]|uniref:hypothetical protein n=1 Tax=Aquabacterium commune TaxID=70586 RepID=UPI003BB08A26